jgi:diguanylate cyclase (GGDEF)-like protein
MENEKVIHFDEIYSMDTRIVNVEVSCDGKDSLTSWVVKTHRPLIVGDLKDQAALEEQMGSEYGQLIVNDDIRSVVIWPLVHENHLLGVMTVESIQAHAYSNYDIEMLELLSSHLAIALKNIIQSNEMIDLITRLNEMSVRDSMTGVYNRQSFNETLKERYGIARFRNKSFTLAITDLDNFKHVNDTYGHHKGDECIVKYAVKLLDIIGKAGQVFRYGGDEFCIIFFNEDISKVLLILNRLKDEVATVFDTHETNHITVSVGVVHIDGSSTKEIMNQDIVSMADDALYHAKKS